MHRNLGSSIALANLLVREITSDQARETSALADAAKERTANDLASIQHGNEFASRLLSSEAKLEKQMENLEEASDAIDGHKSKVQESAESADKAISKSLEEIDALKTEKSELITESFNEFS
jgi:phage shock protein A